MNDLLKDKVVKEVAIYIIKTKNPSINAIQKEFGLGFNRANEIIKLLEELNIISKQEKMTPRKVLVDLDELELLFKE